MIPGAQCLCNRMAAQTITQGKPMHAVLQNNLFYVKEQVGMFKAANSYDIFDPTSNQQIMACREPNLGLLTKLFRFTDYKRMTPFHVEVRTPEGQLVLSVKRAFSLFLSKVEVQDGGGRPSDFSSRNCSRSAESSTFSMHKTRWCVRSRANGRAGTSASFKAKPS